MAGIVLVALLKRTLLGVCHGTGDGVTSRGERAALNCGYCLIMSCSDVRCLRCADGKCKWLAHDFRLGSGGSLAACSLCENVGFVTRLMMRSRVLGDAVRKVG